MLHFIKASSSIELSRSSLEITNPAFSRSKLAYLPQGSVLAVYLFLVAINSVFEQLPKGVLIFVYSDELLLLAVRD